MHYLLNKNIIWGIILILILTFVFGMLFNLKNAFAYEENPFIALHSYSRDSQAWQRIISLTNSETNFNITQYYSSTDRIKISYSGYSNTYFYDNTGNSENVVGGSWMSTPITVNFDTFEYNAPDWFLAELGIIEKIYLNETYMTVSVTNNSVMSQNFRVDHVGLGVVGTTRFELYNSDGNLIRTEKPTSNTDYTEINLPEQGKYYIYLLKDPTETTLFTYINPQLNLTIEYIDNNNLELGQAYKITDLDNFYTINLDEQLPDLIYIYRENKTDETDNQVLNLSPTGKHSGMIESSIINLFSDDNTYFVIVDSEFQNHHIDIDFPIESIQKTDNIPYVPSNIRQIWQEIESSQIDYFIPGGDSTIEFAIDTGIENIDTYNDELIYENKSNQKISVNLYPSSNTNNIYLKQEKRINTDTMQTYWVDVTNFTKAKEQSIQIYPNQRLIIQIYQGTMEFEYPLEYIDGPDYIDYVYGDDYTLIVNSDVYGTDPNSTDGSGLTNNTSSVIIIDDGTTPIIQDSTNILDPNYIYDNPYTDEQSALETIKSSLGIVQNMVGILLDNPLLGIFGFAFSVTIPIAIFKFIRG
jgi:hypothetical protein